MRQITFHDPGDARFPGAEMQQNLEHALYEVLFVLAEFEQTRPQGSTPGAPNADTIDTLHNALLLTRWGLETALIALRDIDAAQAREPD
jgi:hypothetical protein